jgi:hypothetical protein
MQRWLARQAEMRESDAVDAGVIPQEWLSARLAALEAHSMRPANRVVRAR